jgi:hypothetical protein
MSTRRRVIIHLLVGLGISKVIYGFTIPLAMGNERIYIDKTITIVAEKEQNGQMWYGFTTYPMPVASPEGIEAIHSRNMRLCQDYWYYSSGLSEVNTQTHKEVCDSVNAQLTKTQIKERNWSIGMLLGTYYPFFRDWPDEIMRDKDGNIIQPLGDANNANVISVSLKRTIGIKNTFVIEMLYLKQQLYFFPTILGSSTHSLELIVIPLLCTIERTFFALSHSKFKLNIGGGGGLYFQQMKDKKATSIIFPRSGFVFGIHCGLQGEVVLTSYVSLSAEIKGVLTESKSRKIMWRSDSPILIFIKFGGLILGGRINISF